MKEVFVSVQNLNLKFQQKTVLMGLNWIINRGENWVLNGESGSGKTSLAKIIASVENASGEVKINFDLTSKLPCRVLYVESWYQFKNLEGAANFYYQQRYTSQQAKDIISVHAELTQYGNENELPFEKLQAILESLNFSTFAKAQLIELSSGEHKKLQLVKAIWLKPQLLIIDQPYTGLDSDSRKSLNVLLDNLAADGVQLLLITNDFDLPSSINCYTELIDGQLSTANVLKKSLVKKEKYLNPLPEFLRQAPVYTADILVKMVNVNINYGDKQVLRNVNWEIKAGEKWLLQGHNGSGKSTLLSLINGDHPQSYANEIYLFGKSRGSGESVWEIKQHIGLISPEFHWYFDTNATVWESIASGFYDTIGLFQQIPYAKSQQVDELIKYFGLSEHRNEQLLTLPLGKQRLVLLARTIIKNPELLILDEPCQGLDEQQTQYFNDLVDELCSHGRTAIYVGHIESQLPTCLTHQLLLNKTNVINYEKELAS